MVMIPPTIRTNHSSAGKAVRGGVDPGPPAVPELADRVDLGGVDLLLLVGLRLEGGDGVDQVDRRMAGRRRELAVVEDRPLVLEDPIDVGQRERLDPGPLLGRKLVGQEDDVGQGVRLTLGRLAGLLELGPSRRRRSGRGSPRTSCRPPTGGSPRRRGSRSGSSNAAASGRPGVPRSERTVLAPTRKTPER